MGRISPQLNIFIYPAKYTMDILKFLLIAQYG